MEIVREFWSCGVESLDIHCRSLDDDGYLGAEFTVSDGRVRVFFGDTGLAMGWAIVRHRKGYVFVEAFSSLDSGGGVESEVTFTLLTEDVLQARMARVIRFAELNPMSTEAEELKRLRDALSLYRGNNL